VAFAVNTADDATPEAFVAAVFTPPAKVPDAPLLGGANDTIAPLTALPPPSFTVTVRRPPNAVLTVALCGVPLVAVIDAAAPAVLVSAKVAGVETPATLAVTVKLPALVLAVNAADVATPDEFVVAVFAPPANVPEAPLLGAVNVTVTPLTPLPPEFFTVTTSGLANVVLMVALCSVPLVAVIDAAAPAVLASAKLADVETPATLAVTV
jgi:hypothetical protein